ncbi:MAG: flavodoxin [Lachnospiraceae bacterium]|nr:flavodoxin [Lachnospiraceae bacterium]
MRKALIAYFSAGGVTKRAAKSLAEAGGAGLYEIRPAVPYTKEDLNWMDKKSRSTLEMNDPSSRPALADTDADISGCEVIFLGFPIWWYTAPTIIKTFLEAYDFTGKVIVPFATSGGSGLGDTVRTLQEVVPGAEVVEGKMLNGRIDAAELKIWADRFCV